MNNTTKSTYFFKKFGGYHTKYHCFIQDFLDQKQSNTGYFYKIFEKSSKKVIYCSKNIFVILYKPSYGLHKNSHGRLKLSHGL
jgi:hypothetical protein